MLAEIRMIFSKSSNKWLKFTTKSTITTPPYICHLLLQSDIAERWDRAFLHFLENQGNSM